MRLGVVAVCLTLTGSPAAAEDNVFSDAIQCSKAALKLYARYPVRIPRKMLPTRHSTNAPSDGPRPLNWLERIRRRSAWRRWAQANCVKKLGADGCPPAMPYSFYYMEAAKRTFRHDAAIEVFDLRVEAARK